MEDYKNTKLSVASIEKHIKDLETWKGIQSNQSSKGELVHRTELNILIELLKRDMEIAMRTHFETFKKETDSNVASKVDSKDFKDKLANKISVNEYSREMDYLRGMLHTISREMAIAGIGGTTSGGGQGANTALRVLVKQECENKIDTSRFQELMLNKADLS